LLQSSIVSGVVGRKDGNERIDGFGKWSTYIYTLHMAGDMRPHSFLRYRVPHASAHIIRIRKV
jgi:hypothetical protein